MTAPEGGEEVYTRVACGEESVVVWWWGCAVWEVEVVQCGLMRSCAS